jgi:hypothetical protein
MLIATKDTDISTTSHSHLYDSKEVVEMLRPNEGFLSESDSAEAERYNAYGDGTEWYIAKLVAAHLIRNIPLNTSSIKQVDIANNLEAKAEEGLARIVDITDLGASSAKAASGAEEALKTQGQTTLYIAHDLNKDTIPPESFNIPDITDGGEPTYTSPVDLKETVELVDGVIIPPTQRGFCYFYMTGQAFSVDKDVVLSAAQNNDSRSVSFKIEDAFEVANGTNIDELIILLADAINSKTLTELSDNPSAGNIVGNILVAPQRGVDEVRNLNAVKRLLYPDTDLLRTREARFKTAIRVNYLKFDTRRFSIRSNTELLTVAFYTTGDINWQEYEADKDLNKLRNSGRLGIDGLIFGEQKDFRRLAGTSPVSVLLDVAKGNVTPVSIQGNGTDSTTVSDKDSFGGSSDISQTDTFYFAVEDTFTSFSSNYLSLRISTNNYIADVPLLINVDLSGITSLTTNNIGEEIAKRVVDAIYEHTRESHFDEDGKDNSNVLGVLLGEYQHEYLNINKSSNDVSALDLKAPGRDPKDLLAGRVQIVGFKHRELEYKIIADIVSLPPELWVATGNYLSRKTLWVKGKPRSISVDGKLLSSSNIATAETDSQTLSSINASVSKSDASISPILQRVYDRRRLIEESSSYRGRYYQWPN